MEKISQRLIAFIASTKMSKNKFAKHIGTSSAMISKLTTQDVDFRIEILEKIISKYPNLNLTWLLTGVGEMYVNAPTGDTQEIHRTHLINYLERRGIDTGKVNAIDLQAMAAETDSRIAKILDGTSPSLRHPRLKYPFRFRNEITQKHPDIDGLLNNLSIITDVGFLIEDINAGKVGKAVVERPEILLKVKTYQEYKKLSLDALLEILPYKDSFIEFAECSARFIRKMEPLKDALELEYDFEI